MIKLFDWIAKARRRPITQLEPILKRKISEYIKTYKRKPSEREFLTFIRRADRELFDEVQSVLNSMMTRQYKRIQQSTATELRTPLQFTNRDALALNSLTQEGVLTQAVAGLRKETVEGLSDIFMRAYGRDEGLDMRQLQREIKGLTQLADYKVERIARAETWKVSVASRRMSYLQADPSDSFKYVARGPVDNRTSKMSLELQQRTKDGVSWQEYIEISMDIASQFNPKWRVNPLAPLMQPNQRTSPFRKVV